jgi:tungstate transport system substrate-binding protein
MIMRLGASDLPIRFESVSIGSRGIAILDRIMLQIEAGPPTVLVGPNGSGKTTLLRTAMGLVSPTQGRITWAGVEKSPPVRRAIVFQRPAMLRRSVSGNLSYALSVAGIPYRAERIKELLSMVGLANLDKRPARRLSGGEQQRLALARALARDPAILLLDEPTASLDPASTKVIEDIISAIAASGIKVVMSTHDLGEARRIGGEIVLLHRGRVIESANAVEFLNSPKPTKPRHSSPGNCWCEPRKSFMFIRSLLLIAAIVTSLVTQAAAEDKSIVVASTTSTQDSGLFGYLLPIFKEKTGIDVKVVAQGTGQALDTARRGDADVVFVHARSAEEKFLSEGFGVKRYPVMYNDFVLIGLQNDPAGVKGKDIVTALQTIKAKSAPFISRGDRSGTNIAEIELWKDAGIDIAKDKGPWYKEIGQGMGAALNTGSALNAYVLSDRGTWLAFKNRGDLAILVEGDKRLRNQYGVMLVNPAKRTSVKKDLGQQFINWLISADGQKAIADYKINGEQLFYPNANDPNA